MTGGSPKRLAVLAGCNYPNSGHELQGCINDVLAMRQLLVKRLGFNEGDIELLIDAPNSKVLPTGSNIKKALLGMIERAKAGDILFFHFSGHGTRYPLHKDKRRQEEAVVPCDFNLINDVDFRHIVNRLPVDATLTILSDSCHSGGLIDKEKEQIGPSTVAPRSSPSPSLVATPKAIHFDSVLQHLTSVTNLATTDIGAHLLHAFSEDASLEFQPSTGAPLPQKLKADEGILLSGCQANEYSADMSPSEGGGKAHGAFTSAVLEVMGETKPEEWLSNKEVVMRARGVLKEEGFRQQHPCLYCSDENAAAAFLGMRAAAARDKVSGQQLK
ncbi:hypothetical protein MLD38_007643 [Melastoma candidum]|uniref:Uncharacterized protein n=1 Tax=Melastoma candidum TaxID=119954 RepID=A0ACB9RRG4_9MYRT|nr:hypothetical protein MLD38_007643 [Melastoma candidum]